jgi:hypothetical protein
MRLYLENLIKGGNLNVLIVHAKDPSWTGKVER